VSDFRTAEDIMNRGLQRCGATRIVTRTEDTKNASACNFVYDKLREAELRRNVWRFAIRKTVLRAITSTVNVTTPAAYSAIVTYAEGDVVTSASEVWISNDAGNLNNTPGPTSTFWTMVVDSKLVTYPVYDAATTYDFNALVSYGGETWYSLAPGNIGNTPSLASPYWVLYFGSRISQHHDATLSYFAGEIVHLAGVTYLSLQNDNDDLPPSRKWRTLTGATLANLNFIYPVGTGPVTQSATRNVYFLPNGFLREAPQDPKAGSTSFLGAPSGLAYNDWEYENTYIVTRSTDPIVFRFVANVSDVALMDPLFCEGLASRLALEVCEDLTQSGEKLQSIGAAYNRFMSEARVVNGIETGPTEPPEDDYISCRI
jgi:hypothetical protein